MNPIPQVPWVPPVYKDVMMHNGSSQKVIDTDAVQTAFAGQQAFNQQVNSLLTDMITKLRHMQSVLDWVREHYPEILVQYEANKQWLMRLERGDVCHTTEK